MELPPIRRAAAVREPGGLLPLRLLSTGLSGPGAATAADAVGRLLAVQAQNAADAAWGIGLRAPGVTAGDVQSALARQELVLTWTMRGTLHLIRPADAAWLLPLLGPRASGRQAVLRRNEGAGDEAVQRAVTVVRELLEAGPVLRPAVVRALEEDAGLSRAAASNVLRYLAQEQIIVFGPPGGKSPSFDLYARVVPAAPPLSREQAMARLAVRYFSGHGPATVRDLAWWSGLTLGDARLAVERAGTALTVLQAEGQQWYLTPERLEEEPPSPDRTVHLLPGFDEYHIGYAGRELILDPAHRGVVGPAKNGLFRNVVLVGGRIAGVWTRGRDASVTVETFDGSPYPAGTDPDQLRRAGEAYARFTGT